MFHRRQMLSHFCLRSKNYMRSVIREISKASNLNDLETLNSDSSFVIFNEVNNRGLITLNRQEKANALNLEMVAAIKRQIKNWKNKVDMIIIRGHDRVFSAGGDLVHFNTNLHKAYEFGKIAYSLDYDISTLHIPYVAIIPGAAFGNGVGLGAFGSALIATETTVLGMPETQLGFFTDAGMTYVFSRMPGGLGMYLALTGYSLKGVDSVKAGLASHFVKNSILPELTESLLNGKIDSRNIQRDLLNYTTNVDLETFSLDCFRRDIDRIFTLPRIEDMVMELEKCNTEWSVKTLETLQKMSPTCLKMTARMLREAKDKTLKECLQRELQMNWVITHSSPSRDFREGINAKLIRKDQNPKWNPGTIVEVTDEMMDELFNTQLPSSEGSISNIDDGEYHCNKTQIRKVISGVVGAASSVTSIQVANLLRLFKIPQVSFFSTSPELSNKQRFEYFTRTIPSDHHQVKAMVEIVRRLGWSYVSIIYEESNYGIKAFEELEALLAKHDICIAIKEKLVKDSGVAEEIAYDNTVLKLLTKPRAKGCIIFGSDQEVAGVMRAVRRCNATGLFSWIGSDGWSARDLVSLGNEPEVEGTLSVQPQANPVLGFEEYFLNLTVENNRRNPWFVEFWEDHFQCKYPNSSRTPYNKKYTRQCSRQERLTRENTAFENQLQFVSDAVMALAIALQDMHRELCPGAKGMCERMIPTKGHDLLKYLRSVNFEGLSGDKFKFDSNGDGPARYNIIHFKKISKNIYQWVKVGEYLEGSLRLNMTDIQFKMGGQRPPESVCSLPCEVGQAKKYVEGESCCWHCFNCTQYQIRNPADETQCLLCPLGTIPVRDKNVCLEIPEAFLRVESAWAISAMIISTSGIIVTLFVAGVFMRHNETPVVKAAGRELSYVLLTGILLCYLITFILVLKPSSFVCGLQRFGAGFCFTVVYAALLTKTNRIARIFNAGKRTAKRPSFINPRSQLLICSALASVQVIINIVWMIVSPPKAIHHYPTREDNLLVCSTFVDASYMIAFGYPIFLIVVCTIYAILTRNIPEAFNESKHIVFTMYTTCVIWLAFVPLYFVTGNHMPLRITSMSVAISLSACVTIGCLFSPKLYIILIRPERNVRQSMMPTTRYSGTVKSGTSASVMAAAVAVTDTPQRLSHTFVRAVDATGREFELKCEGIAIRAKTQFVSRATQTVTTTLPDNNNSQTTEAGSTAILSAPIVVDSPPTVGHASGDAQSTVLGNGPVSNDVQL